MPPAAKDAAPAERVEADVEVGIIFTEVNETVTAKQETNLRNEPSTNNDASIVGRLVHGDTATRPPGRESGTTAGRG